MPLKHTSIQNKLMRVILVICGVAMLVTSSFYFAYEFFTYRQTTVQHLSTLGEIVANNSTAALAFDSRDDGTEILSALKAEPHIVTGVLYDAKGNLFSQYPDHVTNPTSLEPNEGKSYGFENSSIIGIQPVVQGNRRLGTLYLKSDLEGVYNRFILYGIMACIVMGISLFVAYLLTKRLQKIISTPILSLEETARIIADRKDYSVRATKLNHDEFGLLTDTFNQMLEQIELQNQKIKTFNEALEQSIKERTQELEISNKELEAFSYSVSHDLRAPLRSIDGYARILLEDYADKMDDEGKRTLNVITRNALKMGQLIDDLLDFSRLGKQNVSKIRLDMNALALRVVEEVAAKHYSENNIAINSLQNSYGDSSMVRQVMANLISNAVKYSSKKEKPSIEIGSYQELDQIVYFVKDNGAGFDMNYYSKLFGVFQRLHSVAEFEGTGVGLALVHRIVTKHSGRVWAEGKVNEGATFFFTLPLA